jgi:hypothetical protein
MSGQLASRFLNQVGGDCPQRANLLLVEPTLTQKEIAIRLDRHPATVDRIMNSDLFRARYEQRREVQTAAFREAINTRLVRVSIKALELTEQILAEQRTEVPLPELVDVADKALARLGYGPKMGANPAIVTINHQTAVVAPVTAEELQAARQKLIEAGAHTDRREPRKASAVNLKVE